MPYSPNLIDTSSTDTFGSFAMAPNAYGRAQTNLPIVFGNNLYYVLYGSGNSVPLDTINVFKSTDRGVTWTKLDSGNAPVRGSGQATGGAYFDGISTITVAWTDGTVTVDGVIHLKDFNLNTGTWGTEYGASGSPTVRIVNQIYKRADGSLIALFNRTFAAGRIQGTSAAVWNGTTWGAAFPIDTNLAAGNSTDGRAATVFDPNTQTLHVFMRCANTATFFPPFWFYQQVLSDNSLGNFNQFATNFVNSVTNGNGNPVIVGSQIIFGVMNFAATHATIMVGTPLAAPVWSVMPDPGIDPSSPFSQIGYTPVLAASSTTLYALIATDDNSMGPPDDLQLRLCSTSNLANPEAGPWNETTIYDISSGPPSFNFSGQEWNNVCIGIFNNSQIFVSAGAAIDVTASQDTWFWFGIFTPLSPVLGGSSPLAGAATGARFKPCNRFNKWEAAQMAEKLRYAIDKSEAWPYRHLFPAKIDIPVNQIADIPAPALNTLTAVLSYRVPSGFRFVMLGLLEDGPTGILPGDVLWTVDQNAQAPNVQSQVVQGLQNIPVPLGSIAKGVPWVFRMPYIFEPLTLLRSTVVNTTIPPGAPNFFTSGFFGYLVPVLSK